jgi:hypothetical protein
VSTARERSGIQLPGKLTAVEVAGERIVIDVRAMTIRERQMARAEVGKLENPDEIDSQVAAIWITLRRRNPELTFADLCDSLTLNELDTIEQIEDTDSPEV